MQVVLYDDRIHKVVFVTETVKSGGGGGGIGVPSDPVSYCERGNIVIKGPGTRIELEAASARMIGDALIRGSSYAEKKDAK